MAQLIQASTVNCTNDRKMGWKKRTFFRWCWSDLADDAETTLLDSALHIIATATGKARQPTVDSITEGSSKEVGSSRFGCASTDTSAGRPCT